MDQGTLCGLSKVAILRISYIPNEGTVAGF